jgi:uncharacterized cupin superfamily protein
MTTPSLPAFDPCDVPESNYTSYPEPFRSENQRRWNRRLGDHAGLKNFGVNLTRIVPGGQSSHRHSHRRQDEFVYVLSGEVVLETNAGRQTLGAATCVAFPAGAGDAHRFVNQSERDCLLLVVGDRTADEEIDYPDVDLRGKLQPDGTIAFFHKDGRAY